MLFRLSFQAQCALAVVLAFSSALSLATGRNRDREPLDPAPTTIHPIFEDRLSVPVNPFAAFLDNPANNLKAAIGNQTRVKAQGHRGTCSIFSAIGAVESLYKIKLAKELDFSENYLEYLVMSRMKSHASEGSDTPWNIPAMQRFGAVFSSTWPYEEWDWTESEDLPEDEAEKAEQTCGSFQGNRQKACLLGHMDPMNDRFRQDAAQVLTNYGLNQLTYGALQSQAQVKAILNNHQPLILSVRFFYKAWNHRKMTEYGLGERDMVAWSKGVVSTPSPQDVQLSSQHPAGHSFVLVGYNDALRVYYFKNSWGTDGFGEKSDFLGSGSTPGYGTITYDYAHNYGTIWGVR